MNDFINLVKILASILVLAILAGLVFYLKGFQQHFSDPVGSTEAKPLEQIINDNKLIGFQPGQREFHQALEAIALGKTEQASQKLSIIQNLHPNSNYGPEARRILGEINIDEILSITNMENKQIYKVEAGDGYLNVATSSDTTLSCIMFLNGLTELGNLREGDELIVMPLDFKISVNIAQKRVVLFYRDDANKEHVFTKEYLIQGMDLPSLSKRSYLSTISRKQGEEGNRTYPPTHARYRNATKVLGFKVGGRYLQFRPVPALDAVDPGSGIFLKPSDMEELAMLIRVGIEVELNNAD